mmetsp:Transcript_24938/g.30026  ORF Transcript_24938/g.30026 Transcript_24938/m.30026 type:complete len:119 (-) Transcript_24938:833-1189(-)
MHYRQLIVRGKKQKANAKPRKLRRSTNEIVEETVNTRKSGKKVFNMDDLPKPWFFLEVCSDGSTVPGYYSKPLYPQRNYHVRDKDTLNAPLWQKKDSTRIVTSSEEQAIKKLKEKFLS